MSHLQLAPGAASWWENSRRKYNGQRFNTIGQADDDPCSRAPRRKALEVPSIYASRFTRERAPHDPSMINPSVLLEGKDDPPMVPSPEPVWPGIWKKPSPLETFKLENRWNSTPLDIRRYPYLVQITVRGQLDLQNSEDPIVTTYLLPRRFFATKSAIMT